MYFKMKALFVGGILIVVGMINHVSADPQVLEPHEFMWQASICFTTPLEKCDTVGHCIRYEGKQVAQWFVFRILM